MNVLQVTLTFPVVPSMLALTWDGLSLSPGMSSDSPLWWDRMEIDIAAADLGCLHTADIQRVTAANIDCFRRIVHHLG